MENDRATEQDDDRHYRTDDDRKKPLHTIYIKNLAEKTRAKELGVIFEKFGKLIRCDVPIPKLGQAPYAFVEFEISDDANKAFEEMQGVEVDESKLELEWAKRRNGRPPMRGRYHRPRGGFRGRSPYSRGPCILY